METTEDTKTLGLGVEEIIAEVNRYCDEKGISLIKLCNDHGLNPDLLYRMKRGGPANPTLRNVNQIALAIGELVIMDYPFNNLPGLYPNHKEDILVAVVDINDISERYITGGYYDGDTNTFIAYGFDMTQNKIVGWMPMPNRANKFIQDCPKDAA